MKIYVVEGYYYPEEPIQFSYHISKRSAQMKAKDMNNSLKYIDNLRERIFDSLGYDFSEEFDDYYFTDDMLYTPISCKVKVYEIEVQA